MYKCIHVNVYNKHLFIQVSIDCLLVPGIILMNKAKNISFVKLIFKWGGTQ